MASNRFPIAKQLLNSIEDDISKLHYLSLNNNHLEEKKKNQNQQHDIISLKNIINKKFDELLQRITDLYQIIKTEEIRSNWNWRIDQLNEHYLDILKHYKEILLQMEQNEKSEFIS